MAASLGANSADKGNLAEVKEEEKYLEKFDKDRPETEIGDHGQIEQNLKPGEPKIIDSILAVPQSDMAFSLETQRVEELLCSMRSSCGFPNLRYEAEFDRFKRIYGELAKNCKEEEGQDCRNIAKTQGETEEAFENRKQGSITENLKKKKRADRDRIRKAGSVQKKRLESFEVYKSATKELEAAECQEVNLSKSFGARSLTKRESDGESVFDEAADLNTYATWPEYSDKTDRDEKTGELKQRRRYEPKTKNEYVIEEASRVVFTMQSTPTLARLFGFAIDVEIDLEELKSAFAEHGRAGELLDQSCFLFLACSPELEKEKGPSPARPVAWTVTKLDRSRRWFWPATEQEIWANEKGTCKAENVPQFDGHVVMGSGSSEGGGPIVYRFDLTSMEIRTAAEMETQRRQTRVTNLMALEPPPSVSCAYSDVQLRAAMWEDLADPTTLQTGGITLLDRGLAQQAARNQAARAIKSENGACIQWDENNRCHHVLLDAEDLTVGVRLDVGVLAKGDITKWRSLTTRLNSFGTSGESQVAEFVDRFLPDLTGGWGNGHRLMLDSAMQTVPARLLPNGETPSDTQNVEAVMEEAIAVWSGAPMGVDPSRAKDKDGKAYISKDTFDFGRTLVTPQNTGTSPKDFLPVELRYGRGYRFKMRTVFQGGVSVAPGDALSSDACLEGKLFYPAGSKTNEYRPFFRFLRQHRIDPPLLVLDRETAMDVHPEMGSHKGKSVVVRSIDLSKEDMTPTDLAALENVDTQDLRKRAWPKQAWRILLPPSTSFQEAERHGSFDTLDEKNPAGLFPKAQLTDTGGFPVSMTITRKGFDGQGYFHRRDISFTPDAKKSDGSEPQENLELGDAILMEHNRGARTGRYYPDPSATIMAFGLRRIGERGYLPCDKPIWFDITKKPKHNGGSTQRAGLDRSPVRLDVHAATDVAPRTNPRLNEILSAKNGLVLVDTGVRKSSWNLKADLAPGEAFHLDFWMVPTKETLAKCFSLPQSLAIYAAITNSVTHCQYASSENLIKGLKDLLPKEIKDKYGQCLGEVASSTDNKSRFVGPGGFVAPPKALLDAIAQILHELMLSAPIPEIASVQTIDITHASNKPVSKPILSDVKLDDQEAFKSPIDYSVLPKDTDRPLRFLRPSHDFLRNASENADTACPEVGGVDTSPSSEMHPIHVGSNEAILDGTLFIPLDTVDAFELVAETVLPGSSQFDNRARARSLLKKREGDWPTYFGDDGKEYHQKAEDIFGFQLDQDGSVTLPKNQFTLLRVENIGRAVADPAKGRYAKLDLRDFWLSDSEPDGRWRVVERHTFPDAKARKLRITPRAISRTSSLMKTARRTTQSTSDFLGGHRFVDEKPLPPEVSFRPGQTVDEVILPATERPAKCDALSPVPVFRHRSGSADKQKGGKSHVAIRETAIRLRLGREWFSSGEDEKLGIVLWPPQLDKTALDGLPLDHYPFLQSDGTEVVLDLQNFLDEDLGEGGKFVTRIGADPIRGQHPYFADFWQRKKDEEKKREYAEDLRLGIFAGQPQFRDLNLPKDDPNRAYFVPEVIMPTVRPGDLTEILPPNKTLTVGLVVYTPRFDPDLEEWYVDVVLSPGLLPEPFVRFGLVRYQPNTRPELQVSEPVVQWAQVMPTRTLSVSENGKDNFLVEVRGPAAFDADDKPRELAAKRISDVENHIDQKQREIDEVKKQIETLNDTDGDHSAEIESKKSRVQSLKEIVGQAKRDLEQLKKEPLPSEDFSRPRLRAKLFRERKVDRKTGKKHQVEILREPLDTCLLELDSESQTIGLPAQTRGWVSSWRFSIGATPAEADEGVLALYLEELEWRRPATYPLEPLDPETLGDPELDLFVPSGPRYSARVDLGHFTGKFEKCETET
ncbi:coiled-coil domain-containing protein [Roseibium alexandrii]